MFEPKRINLLTPKQPHNCHFIIIYGCGTISEPYRKLHILCAIQTNLIKASDMKTTWFENSENDRKMVKMAQKLLQKNPKKKTNMERENYHQVLAEHTGGD